ncbi:hypothetical protein TpMuguga_04g00111 [Theileria parva strain Muguga]|uniref:VPS9 domain-containing protein n=1 Tax=Theileria parva TaxID=5875 RepID=Q4N376_THEPA|nr:uncharacterized protein TpMuguga_04g00111 [Theileria parva strain Muguga]EAN31463.1 hypothetical protein TpMuguga_04g00111 [Theileria parva strain Muguga]|eukprot:XP_763746.1 hypothetical protein [Theileria parva strain Muguga]
MVEIEGNPFLSILEKNYPNLHKSIFSNNNKFIILIPNSQTLINSHINLTFIKSHVLVETGVEGSYVNRCGQVVEMVNDSFITSFGFNNFNICNVTHKHKFNNYIQLYWIDSHLLSRTNSEIDYLKCFNDNPETIVKRWSEENEEFGEYYFNKLNEFNNTFVIVPGYETETANTITNIIEKSMLLLNERREYLRVYDSRIYEILLNHSFSHLFNNLFNALSNSYLPLEDVIQSRIMKLRMELNLNLSLLIFNSRRDMNDINIIPIVEKLHQMEKSVEVWSKLRSLCEAVELNKSKSSEESVSYLILAIVVGSLKHIITHATLIHLYIASITNNNNNLNVWTENLQIFSSAISFLLE